MATRTLEITEHCHCCGKAVSMKVNPIDFECWAQGGVLIQHAMPYLSPGERELLISGTCSICFDKLFLEDEDDAKSEEGENDQGKSPGKG